MVRYKDKIIFFYFQNKIDNEKEKNKDKLKEEDYVKETKILSPSKIKIKGEDIIKTPITPRIINNKHSRCVPLDIYQKVYNDRKKLKIELDNLNNQNLQKEKENLELILQKQEKYVNNLKNKISKYEKELNKKNEEIVSKDNYIKQLTQTIEELNNKIKSMKDNYKKEKKKEIIKLNDQISTLKNELEIKDQKEEMNNVKYNKLQLKYLKMFHNKKKLEQDNLLISSMKQINKKNKENTPNKFNSINNNLDNLNFDTSIILPALKDKTTSKSIKKINVNLFKKIIQENKTEICNDKINEKK